VQQKPTSTSVVVYGSQGFPHQKSAVNQVVEKVGSELAKKVKFGTPGTPKYLVNCFFSHTNKYGNVM